MKPQLKVERAAIRTDDGQVHSLPAPAHHAEIDRMIHGSDGKAIGTRGFLLSDGSFVGRTVAADVARHAGQCDELSHPPGLHSEDLW